MSLRVHHLNCGSMCPACARLINGRGGWLQAAEMVCHVLLIETPKDGLVLVDTGIGTLDVQDPRRMGQAFVSLARPRFDFSETALAQVQALGFSASDVRHIVLTHLDLDHAGGLPDFPQAQVHVLKAEFDAALHPDWRSRLRYLPVQWAHNPRWITHGDGGETWFGLEGLKPIPGLAEDILMIPLAGHTRGHSGVAVRSEKGWLLHCGDAYFHHGQMDEKPHMPAGMALFEQLTQTDRRARLYNLERLRQLRRSNGGDVRLFCAHDAVELERMRKGLPG